jgi:hypothetical protein
VGRLGQSGRLTTMTTTFSYDDLSAAFARVLSRMDDKGETLDEAVEAVYPDFGGMDFRAALLVFAGR